MSTPLSQARIRATRPAWDVVEKARLTVVPRRAGKAPRVPFVSLLTLLLVSGVVGLLLFNTNMQQASFLATSMEEQAAVLAGKEESLKMELDRMRDPQHVAARAKKLGMVPASSPAFVRLSDGKVLGRPTPAGSDDAVRIAPLPPVKPESVRTRTVMAPPPPPSKPARGASARGASAQGGVGGDTTNGQARASRDHGSASRTNGHGAANGARESTGRTP